jgi:hypothetical protein
MKAAELYAIGVTAATFSQAVGEQLDAIEDALGELLDSQLESSLRLEVKHALDAASEARRLMNDLGSKDLFGLLRFADEELSEESSVSNNGA